MNGIDNTIKIRKGKHCVERFGEKRNRINKPK